MDFTTLQDRVKFVLDNNDDQTSQAFSDARVKQAINWARRQEINRAQLECGRQWFIATRDIVWPSSQLTLELPDSIKQAQIIRITDVTDVDPGDSLLFDETGATGTVFFKNRSTLQWMTAGPSEDKTLRIVYYVIPADLVADEDEDDILPEAYHEIYIWSAAILLMKIADQGAPETWMAERDGMRMDLHKFLSKGRPTSDGPRIINTDPDFSDGYIY